MKLLLSIILFISVANANKLQTQANLHLVEAKKDRYYQSQNRYSIMQYTRALKNMFSGLGGNSESNMPNGMPGSIEEMQKMMGKLPMGGGANKFSGMGLPGFSGKPSKRIK